MRADNRWAQTAAESPKTGRCNPSRRAAVKLLGAGVAATALYCGASASRNAGARQGDDFHTLMDSAMDRMHIGMHVVPSGDVDRDFAQMMIPHHQGAVDMAVLELRFGKDLRLRRLAQGIIVEQRQEIQVMQSILAHVASPEPTSGPTAAAPHRDAALGAR